MDVEGLARGVLEGDRGALARAITLVESALPAHQAAARELVARALPRAGGAARVGITGAPGVGKSTLIESLGLHLVRTGRRLAVLAVDPSSPVSGGSILGDKTRMPELSAHPAAFVRPSPAGDSAGGVARRTREALILCEAAGYEVVLVETVGVGQSEVAVSHLVDCFVLLLLAGAGDELQGIKRGVMELAHIVAVTRADRPGAREAVSRVASAMELFSRSVPGWTPPVLACSGRTGEGVGELWGAVERFHRHLEETGLLAERRARQRLYWLERGLRDEMEARLYAHPAVAARLPGLRRAVARGEMSPEAAALELLELAQRPPGPPPPGADESSA